MILLDLHVPFSKRNFYKFVCTLNYMCRRWYFTWCRENGCIIINLARTSLSEGNL